MITRLYIARRSCFRAYEYSNVSPLHFHHNYRYIFFKSLYVRAKRNGCFSALDIRGVSRDNARNYDLRPTDTADNTL